MSTFVFCDESVYLRMSQLNQQQKILVAPLHWGLGHATRCIPIIEALLKSEFKVMLASDGAALSLLKQEFPQLEAIELPSYNITYPKKGHFFKLKLFLKIPHIKKTIASEKKIIQQLVASGKIHGVVSDNRPGIRNEKIPSVFITHQLNVLSGITSYFSSKAQQKIIRKFDECWVPDIEGPNNLSGTLGHLKNSTLPIKYIGLLSRMKKENIPIEYDILCLLSGPEPQRSMLEQKLLSTLKKSDKKILLVRGVVEEKVREEQWGNITVINYLKTEALQFAINRSELIISRSGYTTIMDLAAMDKKTFFIPTPGQYEQEYLAKRLTVDGMVPSCKQADFSIKKLSNISDFKGLEAYKTNDDLEDLFDLFEGERKFGTNT